MRVILTVYFSMRLLWRSNPNSSHYNPVPSILSQVKKQELRYPLSSNPVKWQFGSDLMLPDKRSTPILPKAAPLLPIPLFPCHLSPT
jgi:hypothetical protein